MHAALTYFLKQQYRKCKANDKYICGNITIGSSLAIFFFGGGGALNNVINVEKRFTRAKDPPSSINLEISKYFNTSS